MIGNRLKEERLRLGLTIPELADAAGAKKNTVIDWQNDTSSPPAAKLAELASVGVDVRYVLTGQRSEPFQVGFEGQAEGLRVSTQYSVQDGNPEAVEAYYKSSETLTGIRVLISHREAALLASFRKLSDEGRVAVESTCTALEKAVAKPARSGSK